MDPKKLEHIAAELSSVANANHRELAKLVAMIRKDHLTLQQSLFRNLIYPLILAWAKAEYVDARCEATVETCKLMVKAIEDRWGHEMPPIPYV